MQSTASVFGAIAVAAGLAMSSQASVITLWTNLSGANEVPAVSTLASGVAVLRIDTTTRAWSLNLRFSNLSAPVTVAHIHRAPAGSNGPVIIGLDGIALSGGRPSWNLIAPGSTSLNTNGSLNAPFLFPAAELQNLLDGNTYINIHSSAFPGGELRGNLVIPTPGGLALAGLAGLLVARRRR